MNWNGKMKALTFSYDDGVEQDRRLVEILNRYDLKATFNLNSGMQSGAVIGNNGGVKISRINIAELPQLYAGHEIAVHGLTHPRLEKQDEETIFNEVMEDKCNLERIFRIPVVGMAYPYGTYDDRVLSVVRGCGIKYARTVQSMNSFDLPQGDLLELPATCHHNAPRLMELAQAFVELKPDTPQLFYVWGHSYEFDVEKNWTKIEEFCQIISRRDDIFYGTNAQVLL